MVKGGVTHPTVHRIGATIKSFTAASIRQLDLNWDFEGQLPEQRVNIRVFLGGGHPQEMKRLHRFAPKIPWKRYVVGGSAD